MDLRDTIQWEFYFKSTQLDSDFNNNAWFSERKSKQLSHYAGPGAFNG